VSIPAVFSNPPEAKDSAPPRNRVDELRWLVPVFALAVAVVAVTTDPSSVSDVLLSAIPVLAFAVWAYLPNTPLVAVAVAVLVPTVLVQRSGTHEPLMFEASVLAFVIGCWSSSLAVAVSLGVLAVVSPVVVAVKHVAGACHLQHHRRETMSDEVVHVAGDPPAFLEQRLLGQLPTRGLELGSQLALARDRPPDPPREGDPEHPDSDRDVPLRLDHCDYGRRHDCQHPE